MKEYWIIKLFIFILISSTAVISSCYYDNGDDLLTGGSSDCDTLNMTYTNHIEPIISMSCIGCHSGSAPSGNISLETYDDVKATANDGSLMGTIDHAPGFSAMPKNSPKIDDCSISQIAAWINQGTKN